MARIAVIGGGLAGLVVALRRAEAGDEVTLFEASARLGGQLHSERRDGFVIEHGAEGFVWRSSAVPNVAAAVGIDGALVEQLLHTSYGFDGKALERLERGEAARFLGFQVHGDDLGRGIRSFAEGMGQLADGLARAVAGRVQLHTSTPIQHLERSGARWRLAGAPSGSDGEADAVVIATTARDAARLLEPSFGPVAERVGQAKTVSSVTVSLAFDASAVAHPLDATGFVVRTDQQQEGFRACTFASSKLPGRAPPGCVLVRLFFRPEPADLVGLRDADWVERAERQLARAIPSRGGPTRSWVSRWANALPVFDDEHVARILALNEALTDQGLWLAGSAFHGSGIDAAVRSAESTATALGNAPAGPKA